MSHEQALCNAGKIISKQASDIATLRAALRKAIGYWENGEEANELGSDEAECLVACRAALAKVAS
jgi:hypothetical protein